ncbi:MAG TPA: NPCBM/NEW2 domain-containing protein, partial [Isosphaeraceae bacterium]
TLAIRKLPKPGQEDGAAIGLAIATQNVDQPEATLIREIEPGGADVYRPIEKAGQANARMAQQPMVFDPFGFQPMNAKPAKPPRHTFPARGSTIRLEFRRQGQTVRYQVYDDMDKQPREVGQFALGPGDVAGVKLFASNRSGAEPVDVVFRDLTVHADRITGLGTAVRTVFGTVVHGEPTAIDAGKLVVGGPPPTPNPGSSPNPPKTPAGPAAKPESKPTGPETTKAAVAAAPAATPAPEPKATVAKADAPAPSPATKEAKPAQAAAPPKPPEPKARIPLDEVESITFERASTLSARFVGQPNVDTTMPGGAPAEAPKKPAANANADDLTAPPPGTVNPPKIAKVEPKPNGIRDLHLALSGLNAAAIRQVTINVPTDKGPTSWRLDTSGSPDWPLTLSRAGVESWADLFLEPPAGDCRDKEFTVMVNYADGQQGQAKVKATSATDPKLAFDPNAQAPALDARIYLTGDEQLFGKLETIGEETLGLTTPWGDRVDVPLARVVAVYMGMADHKESPDAFAKRLKARGSEDLLLARAKDGEVVAIAGVVEAASANKLTFRYQDKSRSLPLKGVEGLVLASRPDPKPPAELRPTFTLTGGIVVSGRWTALEAASWKVETPWGQTLKLPAADVRHVRFRGGQMTYLSDLVPSHVEETPYFGRRTPYRRDVNLAGEPLKLDGQAYDRGIAVHSRSDLTYDLDRRYATFEAVVGFDDGAKKKGRVDCRVFADGKELYANPDLRGDAPPVRLSLPVAGAEQLRLVVDFGPDEDTGDRVIWADARLYRKPPPASGP